MVKKTVCVPERQVIRRKVEFVKKVKKSMEVKNDR